VTVLPRPSVQSVAFAGGNATLTWNAGSGVTYRVQYKNDLGDANWTNLLPDVTATGSTASFADTSGFAQRFYRILVVN
jgi:hypothetical protein